MASKLWKRIEKSRRYRLVKTRLRQVIGVEPWVATDVDNVAISEGGWTYCPQYLNGNSTVYSFGVGDDVSFDINLIRRTGATVHAFDPTVTLDDLRLVFNLPETFHFHPWAAAGRDGEIMLYPRVRNGSPSTNMFTLAAEPEVQSLAKRVQARTIPSIAATLGHTHIDLIKIDIEGAEYEVLQSLMRSDIRPTQLLVEFHHRHDAFTKHDTLNAIRQLRETGYRVFSCSESVREIGFLLRNQ